MWDAVRPDSADGDHYRRMRLAIGLLGLALPPLLVTLEPWLFEGQPSPRGSLSAYYYSGLREVFVGGVCAIGVFLFSYKLAQLSLENLFSMLAGTAAVVVAIFPTQRPGEGFPETPLQQLVGEDRVRLIHFGAALVFIGLLIGLSLIFAIFGGGGARRVVHVGCAVAIAAAAVLALYAWRTGGPDKALLYAEWTAIWAFGISWLTALDFSAG